MASLQGEPQAPVRLTVRDRRFAAHLPREATGHRVARAWLVALSASFPRGEAMFIEAVKAHRDGVPPALAAQIRDFIRQENNHSREHLAFNRLAAEAGYDLARIDARVAALVAMTQAKPPIVRLAVTCALEHFTAIFAREFLTRPERYIGSGLGEPDLWLWHSVEEIEHKAVAFDVMLHVTRAWPGGRRYRLRALIMLLVTMRFLSNRWRDAVELLRQDGMGPIEARLRLAWHIWGRPGMVRRIAPAWAAWFRPGFHPWDHDDSALIARFDEAPEAAPAAPAAALP